MNKFKTREYIKKPIKEGAKKLKDTIQKLRARNRYLEKKIKYYETEIINTRVHTTDHSEEELRKDFLRKFRADLRARNRNG